MNSQPLEQRIGVGSRVYHMTPESNWKKIQKEGVLRPKSTIEFQLHDEPSRDFFIVHNFTVCGVRKDFSDWNECGLLKYLMDSIACRGTLGTRENVILLSFNLETLENIFIRDYFPLSPKQCIEVYGRTVFPLFYPTSEERERFQKQKSLVIQSTARLQNYDGSCKVPEILVPYEVPIDKITFEGEFK